MIRRMLVLARTRNFVFRCIAVGMVLALVAAVCLVRLASTQLIEGAATAQAATQSRTLSVPLSAKRGRVLDANGTVLAQSVDRYTIVANPQAAQDFVPVTCSGDNKDECHEIDGKPVGAKGAAAVARLLSNVLGMNSMELGATLSGDGQYVVIKKDVSPQV